MELKDFIKNALVGIIQGVEEANELENRFQMSGSYHSGKNIQGEFVEFELSVMVDETKEDSRKAGIGIKVANLFSGEVSGEDRQKEQNQNINKLKFKVFVADKAK